MTVACLGDAPASVSATDVVDINDVRVDTFRASGPGGQHRNKTDSAVRLTHLPSGVVVTATESRSQHQNRSVAFTRLSELLAEQRSQDAHARGNEQRQEALTEHRTFVWTAWRDEVRLPSGRKARMKDALRGRTDRLLK